LGPVIGMRGRTVAARIREVDRSLEARNEPAIRIGRGVGQRGDRFRVLDDPADVVERDIGKSGVAVATEEGLALLPDRLVGMHAAAVVAEHRLRHERRRLAVLSRDVLDHVLEPHELVGAVHEALELHADLTLAARGDLVVTDFDLDAGLGQRGHHRLPEIAERVGRRHGKISLFVARLVSEIR